MEANREVAVEVSKEEEKEEEVTSTNNKAEEDNTTGGGRTGGNTRLGPGCRLTTSNIKMGCMSHNSNMASKEEENSRFRDQKRTQKTLTHHTRLLQ